MLHLTADFNFIYQNKISHMYYLLETTDNFETEEWRKVATKSNSDCKARSRNVIF